MRRAGLRPDSLPHGRPPAPGPAHGMQPRRPPGDTHTHTHARPGGHAAPARPPRPGAVLPAAVGSGGCAPIASVPSRRLRPQALGLQAAQQALHALAHGGAHAACHRVGGRRGQAGAGSLGPRVQALLVAQLRAAGEQERGGWGRGPGGGNSPCKRPAGPRSAPPRWAHTTPCGSGTRRARWP